MAIPLILAGNLAIGPRTSGVDTTDEDAAIDVSAEVTRFVVKAAVSTISIPASMSTPIGFRGGAADYSIDLGFMSTDGITGLIFDLLWTATQTQSKEMGFWGSLHGGVVSATNPLWSGTFVVTNLDLGGPADTLSLSSATYPLTGAPTQVTVDY